MTTFKELDADALRPCCDPDVLDFESTAELEDLPGIIGQPRAVQAMKLGINMDQKGYNIFALGPSGTGKRGLVRRLFEEKAAQEPVPEDWCYVNNFEQAHKPRALRLPPGQGQVLKQDMENLVEELRTALSAAFESDEYHARRQEVEEEFREFQETAFEELQREAKEKGLAVLRTQAGLVFAPTRDDQVLSPEELQNLPAERRQELEDEVGRLQEELQKRLRQLPRWQREIRDRLKELNREFANLAVSSHITELRDKYRDQSNVVEYLDAVQKDIAENVKDILMQDEEQPQPEADGSNPMPSQNLLQRPAAGGRPLRRYRVNVLVDHRDSTGAPVIHEDNPTYQTLVGRAEHIAQMGALMTDFNLLKPGTLHRANGGYLIIEARSLLLQPYAWEGLKRALRSGQIHIESPDQMYNLISTVSLEPEPIPLRVKVALLGEPVLYYLLAQSDPDFGDLFKVAADFADQMERTPENQRLYARLIAHLIKQNDLRPFDRQAVSRVIDHSVRLAGDTAKLSAQVRDVANLLREASFWAGEAGHDLVRAEDVQTAIEARIYRSDRLREGIQEDIRRETIFIDTAGKTIGQVNGLSVIQLGDFAFGRPSRITARVWLGTGNVVDIEREVELSGPIHSKGVLILTGFLGARYATDQPLALSASLVFEQSYGGIEGDSASSAELYALLSAIAEVPIKQSLAVTGSINQRGQVQPIGGANEKIEGFFDVCRAKGLTGDQGVLIPVANVKHLMLRPDVVQAVAEGQFHIYPVETIDQGIEILTDMPAGEPDDAGNYPENSINGRVKARLAGLAQKQQEFSRSDGKGEA